MTKNLVNPENHILSIQVSLDGFSFYIKNDTTKAVVESGNFQFEHSRSPEQALIELKAIFSDLALLNNTFKEVIVIYDNELFTIVPKALFDQDKLADYLKFNVKLLHTDFTVFDELPEYELFNVYLPFSNITNFFFDHFGSFTYYHSQSIFLKTILRQSKEEENKAMHIHLSKNTLAILANKGETLLLNNKFSYTNTADCLYYILYCYEQLQLDPEITPVTLYGCISAEDPIFKLIYDYVRHVNLGNPEGHLQELNSSYLHYLINL